MKRRFWLLFTLICILLGLALTANAADIVDSGTCGDHLTWTLDSEGTLTISGTGEMHSYASANAAPWYANRSSIKKVAIESGVTSIGDYAISSCDNLESVSIPDSVTSIGHHGIFYCVSLESITIPDSVTSIGSNAFYNCESLKSITVPESVTSIGEAAFGDCDSLDGIWVDADNPNFSSDSFGVLFNKDKTTLLTAPAAMGGSYAVPDSVTGIAAAAFRGCSVLTSVTIPEGVTSIESRTFSYCSSLESVSIPDSVTSIGNDAFFYCSSLKSINIPDGVTSIDDEVFFDCNSLESITLPDSVTSIGKSAFSSCDSLTSITIPDGVTSIGDSAFSSCYSLTSVAIPGSVTSIGERAFSSCYSLESITIPDGVTSIGNSAFSWCDSLKSITIPARVTNIGNSAFSQCISLEEIKFQGDAPQIGTDAFGSVTATANYSVRNSTWTADVLQDYGGDITWVAVDNAIASGICGDNLTWTLDDTGTLTISGTGRMYDYSLATTAWYWHGNCDAIKTVVIRNGATSIGENVFHSCSNLTSITIPDSVTDIGDSAFFYCSSLTSITIPEGVTSIGYAAFSGCVSLKSITIPDSVTSIGGDTFSGCSSLTGIWISEGNPNYCNDALGVVFNKEKTKLVAAPGAIAGSYVIPDGVTSIGDWAFSVCNSLTSVAIPDSVTDIGSYAFTDCSNLTDINIPDGVTSINHAAFNECSSLSSITIPEGVTSIGGWAFSGCNLTSINIPDGVTSIGDYAFCSCNFTSITIPEGVTSIGEYAFSFCSSLESITLPKGVTNIGDYAFSQCRSLEEIKFQGDAPEIGRNAFWHVYAIANYPANNSTWTEDILQDYGGDITWVATGNTIASGVCGDNLTWTLDDNGTLTISGTGRMYDYGYGSAPWFEYRDAIKTVVIENGATSIGDWAFCYCSSLNSVTIGDSVTTIGDYAFENCSSLTSITIPDGVTSLGAGAFSYCSNLASIILPESATSIGRSLFRACTSLTSITIPDSVTSIGDGAFAWCNSLKTIWVDADNQNFSSDSFGVLFNKEKTTLIVAPCAMGGSYAVPGSVTSIGNFAFENCSSLKSINIPDGVTSIGDYAFYDCGSLMKIEFCGNAPEMGEDSFGGVTATANYPARNSTWTAEVMQDYGGDITWVAYERVEKFDLAGANLELSNDITMYFYVNAADVADGYYMEIVKTNADGTKVTKTVAKADWTAYGSTMYYVGFNGMAAKEMADEISVTVYNAEGVQVSNTITTSISSYALRALDNAAYAKMHTLMADLLNYGAAAQTFFKYNTDHLANANMTETHKGYATKGFDMSNYKNQAVAGAGAMGANLSLETNILHFFYFDPSVVDSSMTAWVSYTNYKGAGKRAVITGDQFTILSGLTCVKVGILVPADVMSLVTVEIVNAKGDVVATVSDSIASYAVRAYGNATKDTDKALYVELMKYCLSSKNYFG